VQNLTYNEIVAQLPSYLQRQDEAFIAQIPTFVTLAENRLATDMKQQGFQSVVTGTLPLVPSLAKPAWWRETISFTFKRPMGTTPETYEYTPINLRSLEYIRNYWPNAAAKDTPRFYGDYNVSNFIFGPTPDSAYEFELVYYARLQPLDADNQTNWMTLNVPQALLYACLLDGALWKKNATDIATWQAQYDSAKGSILAENDERLGDRNESVKRG
jgi:hypothetical protein